eukprot:TRINITY_DN105389_c1_g1_i1.p2 TRINITY_DN105389_c1_g1~~TRINITY_DN105389_c1_g1_i1.p2  ORF type:complete len:639 (+),score=77.69 TRINITY_DN105389_c1_g1_i1:3994-5910(+)
MRPMTRNVKRPEGTTQSRSGSLKRFQLLLQLAGNTPLRTPTDITQQVQSFSLPASIGNLENRKTHSRKSTLTKVTTTSNTCIESVKKNNACTKPKPRLSFGKNQKLNFIFGANLQPKPVPFQDVLKPITPTNQLSSSEIDTPRLNILPTIRTVNIELEQQESPHGSLPESTYEEIDMRTESSVEAPEEPEEALAEVKKRLNEIAQQMCSDPIEKTHTKTASDLGLKCQNVTKVDDSKAKCYEIAERAIRKLTECKGGIKLLHDFSENLAKIESSSEISEKERLLQLKLSIAHMQQAVQGFSLKSIEEDIEFLKRSTCDKESVATSATYTMTDTPQVELQRKSGKYQMQVGRIHLENSVLRKLINGIESNLKDIGSTKETVPGINIATQVSTEENTVLDNTKQKLMLSLMAGIARARKEEMLQDHEDKLKEAIEETLKMKAVEKELREELAKKDEEIQKLRRNCPEHVHELTIEPSKIPAKNANQLSALASIMICKSESIANGFHEGSFKKQMHEEEKVVQKECLKRLISLKAVARTMFNLLLTSAKVRVTQIKSSKQTGKDVAAGISEVLGKWLEGDEEDDNGMQEKVFGVLDQPENSVRRQLTAPSEKLDQGQAHYYSYGITKMRICIYYIRQCYYD